MTAPRLWVVRHAPVRAQGLCYGQSDVPTEIDANAAAGSVLEQLRARGVAIARVWSSPWERTRELADAIATELAVPLRIDARLSELAFGAWEGRTYASLEAEDGERFARWMAEWRTAAPPGGETLDALLARVAAWSREARGEGSATLAVTHAGPIRALRAANRGVDYGVVLREPVPHLALEEISAR